MEETPGDKLMTCKTSAVAVCCSSEWRYAGTTMAVYSCIGFGGGFLGNVLFGATLDRFGGAAKHRAWVISLATCGVAFIVGASAMTFLPRHVERAHRRPRLRPHS